MLLKKAVDQIWALTWSSTIYWEFKMTKNYQIHGAIFNMITILVLLRTGNELDKE